MTDRPLLPDCGPAQRPRRAAPPSREASPLPVLLLFPARFFTSTPSPGLLSRLSLLAPVLRRPHAPTRQALTLSVFFQTFVLHTLLSMALKRAVEVNRWGGEMRQYLWTSPHRRIAHHRFPPQRSALFLPGLQRKHWGGDTQAGHQLAIVSFIASLGQPSSSRAPSPRSSLVPPGFPSSRYPISCSAQSCASFWCWASSSPGGRAGFCPPPSQARLRRRALQPIGRLIQQGEGELGAHPRLHGILSSLSEIVGRGNPSVQAQRQSAQRPKSSSECPSSAKFVFIAMAAKISPGRQVSTSRTRWQRVQVTWW